MQTGLAGRAGHVDVRLESVSVPVPARIGGVGRSVDRLPLVVSDRKFLVYNHRILETVPVVGGF